MRLPTPVPPFVADPAGVADFGRDVLAASAIFDDAGSFASGPARCRSWWGGAGDAYHQTICVLARRADALSLASRSIGGRILGHADSLIELQGRHDDLDRRYSRLVTRLADEIAGAIRGTPAGDASDWRDAPQDADVVERLVAAYEGDRARWIADLREAEEEMRGTFRRLTTEAQVEQRYGGAPDPADRIAVPPGGTPPASVRAWWRQLTPRQRLALLTASPTLLGNLDGLPATARDLANRTSLGRDLAEITAIPRSDRTRIEQNRLDNARATRRAIGAMQLTDPSTGDRVPVQLYGYDPDAFDQDGSVSIAVGDLDSAANLAVTVPGFGTDMQSAPDQAVKAINLYQASRFLHPQDTSAVLFWIGYDAPDRADGTGDGDGWGRGADVLDDRLAKAGGDRLAHLVRGINEMRDADPHLTVIGHSYGSTTAADGASVARHGDIDDLVLVGSPGAGNGHHHATDLGIADGHVWVGRNSADPIADLGDNGWWNPRDLDPGGPVPAIGLGADPSGDGFGATRFEAEDPSRDAGGLRGLLGTHTSYFDHDTESLANMAHIVSGHDAQVATAPGVHDPLVPDPGNAPRGLWDLDLGIGRSAGDLAHGHGWDALADAGRGAERGWDALTGGPQDPEAHRPPTSPHTR